MKQVQAYTLEEKKKFLDLLNNRYAYDNHILLCIHGNGRDKILRKIKKSSDVYYEILLPIKNVHSYINYPLLSNKPHTSLYTYTQKYKQERPKLIMAVLKPEVKDYIQVMAKMNHYFEYKYYSDEEQLSHYLKDLIHDVYPVTKYRKYYINLYTAVHAMGTFSDATNFLGIESFDDKDGKVVQPVKIIE